MIREPVMANPPIKISLASWESSHVMFERGRGQGEPSDRLRRWMQTSLCAIRRQVVVTAGRGNSPLIFFSNSKDTAGRVHCECPHSNTKGKWRDAPPLDRLLTCRRRDTEEMKVTLVGLVRSDEVPAVKGGVISLNV